MTEFSTSGDLRPLTSCDFSPRYHHHHHQQQQQSASYFHTPYHHQHLYHNPQHQQRTGYGVYFTDEWRHREPASAAALNHHHSLRNTINPQSVV